MINVLLQHPVLQWLLMPLCVLPPLLRILSLPSTRLQEVLLAQQLSQQEGKEQKATGAEAGAKQRSPSILRALRRAFLPELLRAAAFKLVWGTLIVTSASFFVRYLLNWLKNPQGPDGWIVSVFFFVCCMMLSVALQQMNATSSRLGLRVYAAVSTAIYRKIFKLDTATSKFDVVSLTATDCLKVMEACTTLNFLWSGIVEALAIIGVLIGFVGRSALPGEWWGQ